MIQVALKELRKALATLYSDEDSVRAFVDFGCTSIQSETIDFKGSAIAMWSKVLTEAMKHSNGISEIVNSANEEYPDNEIIQSACAEGVESFSVKEDEKEKYIPFRNILKRINKDNFGEIKRVDCNRSAQVKQYYKSMDNSCTITYSIGTNKDKPNSFAERIMLQTIEDSKDIDSGKNNCWLYRQPNGDFRVDEIPFDIRPNLDLSKNLFCKKMESLLEGLNMDNAKEYFAHQNYKNFSIAINFNYSLGDEILEPFTEWIYETFSGIDETNFQIFFVLTGVQNVNTLLSNINHIIKSLDSVPIIPIQVINPVKDKDIQDWKGLNNLDSYTRDEFITDLNYLNVPEEDINEFKSTKKISMQIMELFQNSLYDAFHKNI